MADEDLPLADPMFLELLARTHPPSHYRLGEEGRYYGLWRIRQGLKAASAAMAACALLWVAGNLWGYVEAQRDGERLDREAAGFDASYRVSMSDMPPSLAPTANMKAAVTVERLLATQAPAPIDMMGMLSAALDKVPQVRVARLEWRVAADGKPDAAQGGGGGGDAEPIPSRVLGIPSKPPQSLRVEAEVALMSNNARGIVDSMNAFAQELARNPKLTVAIERTVLDISPGAKLSGSTAAAAGDKPAQFILNLSLAP